MPLRSGTKTWTHTDSIHRKESSKWDLARSPIFLIVAHQLEKQAHVNFNWITLAVIFSVYSEESSLHLNSTFSIWRQLIKLLFTSSFSALSHFFFLGAHWVGERCVYFVSRMKKWRYRVLPAGFLRHTGRSVFGRPTCQGAVCVFRGQSSLYFRLEFWLPVVTGKSRMTVDEELTSCFHSKLNKILSDVPMRGDRNNDAGNGRLFHEQYELLLWPGAYRCLTASMKSSRETSFKTPSLPLWDNMTLANSMNEIQT